MSFAIKINPRNLGSRPKQVQFAITDVGECSYIIHHLVRPNSNICVRSLVCSAIIVIAASGCYGRVGLEEPRHEQRTEVRHEERHPVAEHREERHEEEHHD